jgi:hypothetical protein
VDKARKVIERMVKTLMHLLPLWKSITRNCGMWVIYSNECRERYSKREAGALARVGDRGELVE